MLIALACVPLLIWIYLLLGRNGFWRVSRAFAPVSDGSVLNATVVAVTPARNEAESIGQTVRSLMQQNNTNPLRIIVVDDESSDDTAKIAQTVGASLNRSSLLTVLHSRPRPDGWTGKMWAVGQGVAEAETLRPDFLLLTDADIQHAPTSVSELMELATSGHYDLVSYMVKLNCETVAEQALIPAFVFFFFLLYPPAAVRSPRWNLAGAAGGCMLIRTAALQRAGGIANIRSEVIDDCALAKAVKSSGGRVWLGLTPHTRSLRKYVTWSEIEHMIARTAFNQLRHSWLLLFGTCIGLALTYLLPITLLFSGRPTPAIIGLITWMLMSAAYFPMIRFYETNPLWSLSLPFAALFYMAATVHSAIQHATGRGGQWKGRTQDIAG
jgi:hopene-associated glycosyltransferase HpnB